MYSPIVFCILTYILAIVVEYLQHPALRYVDWIVFDPLEGIPEHLQCPIFAISSKIVTHTPKQWENVTQSAFHLFPNYFGNLCEIWKLKTTSNFSDLCIQPKTICQLQNGFLKIEKIVKGEESLAVTKIQDIFRTNYDSNYAHQNLISAFANFNKYLSKPKDALTRSDFNKSFIKQFNFDGKTRLERLIKKSYEEFMNIAYQFTYCSTDIQDFLLNQQNKCLQENNTSLCDKLKNISIENIQLKIEEILMYQTILLSVNDPWSMFMSRFFYLQFYLSSGISTLMTLFEFFPNLPFLLIELIEEQCYWSFMAKDFDTYCMMFWTYRFSVYKDMCRKYAKMKSTVNPKKLNNHRKRLKMKK